VSIIATVQMYDAQFFYKEWQIMLGKHLVLMTLHDQFTISIEQDK